MKKIESISDELIMLAEQGEVGSVVAEKIEELAEAVENESTPLYRRFMYKDGEFSKTAFFTSLANFMIFAAFFVQSFLAGTSIAFGDVFTWVVPKFDIAAAAALLAIANGTYVGNNVIKKRV